jgi:hypothetical protein
LAVAPREIVDRRPRDRNPAAVHAAKRVPSENAALASSAMSAVSGCASSPLIAPPALSTTAYTI